MPKHEDGFVADGGSEVTTGFYANSAGLSIGGHFQAVTVGVHGQGYQSGVYAWGDLIGVDANSNGVGVKAGGREGGVQGLSDNADGILGESFSPESTHAGVRGRNTGAIDSGGIGVRGEGTFHDGVQGETFSVDHAGVAGLHHKGGTAIVGWSDQTTSTTPDDNKGTGVSGFGNQLGVRGEVSQNVHASDQSKTYGVWGINNVGGIGVRGESNDKSGVQGESYKPNGIGVEGLNDDKNGYGVYGRSENGIGVIGTCGKFHFPGGRTGGVAAGVFFGPVVVEGPLTVSGVKIGLVLHPDGSHRSAYSVESPESWFEDFGQADLVNGAAEVKLDPEFAAVVHMQGYHVFLTPYGDSNGLCVSKRGHHSFHVHEQQGGKSNIAFAYRIVAKRKDVEHERFKKVNLPKLLVDVPA